jgi:hypothetical protein
MPPNSEEPATVLDGAGPGIACLAASGPENGSHISLAQDTAGPPRVFGQAVEYDELIDAIKVAVAARQIGVQSFDAAEVSGLAAGHLAKLLSPKSSGRHFTRATLGLVLALVGAKLVVIEDVEAWRRVAGRLERRTESRVRDRRLHYSIAVHKGPKFAGACLRRAGQWLAFDAERRKIGAFEKRADAVEAVLRRGDES